MNLSDQISVHCDENYPQRKMNVCVIQHGLFCLFSADEWNNPRRIFHQLNCCFREEIMDQPNLLPLILIIMVCLIRVIPSSIDTQKAVLFQSLNEVRTHYKVLKLVWLSLSAQTCLRSISLGLRWLEFHWIEWFSVLSLSGS